MSKRSKKGCDNMNNFKIKAVVDESSLHSLVESGYLQTDFEPQNIEWKAGEGFNDGDKIIIPVYAVGYKDAPSKNRFSDEELQRVLGQSPLRSLPDLCAEQSHMDCYRCPTLEIRSDPFPDGTPLLRKE